MTTVRIGVALSGGGHRASAWGTGVLAAVVDAGLGPDVVSVSSVSGGSITNGVVAQNLDLRTATPDQFDGAVRDSLVNYALVGLFPKGPLTKGYLRLVIATLALAILSIVALLVAFVAAAASWMNGATAAAVLVALGFVTIVAWVALAVLVARRGSVVRSAIARTHFGGARRSLGTRLNEIDRKVNHVFLTTDLEAGDQFYLSPSFLYGFREGIADPGVAGTALAEAVQASAALPGAFPSGRVAHRSVSASLEGSRWRAQDPAGTRDPERWRRVRQHGRPVGGRPRGPHEQVAGTRRDPGSGRRADRRQLVCRLGLGPVRGDGLAEARGDCSDAEPRSAIRRVDQPPTPRARCGPGWTTSARASVSAVSSS